MEHAFLITFLCPNTALPCYIPSLPALRWRTEQPAAPLRLLLAIGKKYQNLQGVGLTFAGWHSNFLVLYANREYMGNTKQEGESAYSICTGTAISPDSHGVERSRAMMKETHVCMVYPYGMAWQYPCRRTDSISGQAARQCYHQQWKQPQAPNKHNHTAARTNPSTGRPFTRPWSGRNSISSSHGS